MKAIRFLLVVLAVCGVASVARAAEFADNFDSYAADTPLHGTAGWKGWDSAASAGAPTSDKYAYSGTNSVEIVPAADLVHEFAIAGGRWEFSAMQYIPSGTTGTSFFILLNTYKDGGPNDWSVQTEFRLGAGEIVPWHGGVSATILYDQWVEVKFVINLDKNTVDEYYNGEWIFTDVWDDGNKNTLQALDLYGNNASSVYYDDIELSQIFVYTAQEPNPADGTTGVLQPLFQWVKGDTAVLHNIYLGTSPELTEADLKASRQPMTLYYHMAGLEAGVTYYWRVDEIGPDDTVYTGDVWQFTAAPATAYEPSPRNGDKWIDPKMSVSWLAGQGATSHDIYFGADQEAVANRDASVFKGNQKIPTFEPGPLEPGMTYYWAIDELGAATHAGDVWRFTTADGAGGVKAEYFQGMGVSGAPIVVQIEPSIDHSWGSAVVAGDVTDNVSARWTADLEIAVADTYTFITTSDDGVRLWLDDERIVNNWTDHGTTDNRSRSMYLEPGIYSLRMEWYDNTGGAVARLAWETPTMQRQIIPAGPLQPPVRAKAWYPKNGDVDVPQDAILLWSAGDQAVEHDVYFGQDEAAVAAATPADAAYQGGQALEQTGFGPGALEPGQTYFWRVDEVNDAAADSPWVGAAWGFTVADFLVLDNFESYRDDMDAGDAIFQTWLDGVENSTGSTVGYWEADGGTFGEKTIVHGGRQSMPLDYNNVDPPYYSETSRTWSPVQDLTALGGDTLSLAVRGKGSNGAAVLYVALEDSAGQIAVVAYADDTAVTTANWTVWSIPVADFAGVNPARIKTMYIGAGDRSAPSPGGAGTIYIDDVQVITAPQQ